MIKGDSMKNNLLQTYSQRQTTLYITAVIFILFIISDIRSIVIHNNWVPIALASFSLIVFLGLLSINIKKLIHNYKRRP